MPFCRECGATINSSDKFCNNCGTKLQTSEDKITESISIEKANASDAPLDSSSIQTQTESSNLLKDPQNKNVASNNIDANIASELAKIPEALRNVIASHMLNDVFIQENKKIFIYPLESTQKMINTVDSFNRGIKLNNVLLMVDDSPTEYFTRGFIITEKYNYAKVPDVELAGMRDYDYIKNLYSWKNNILIQEDKYIVYEFKNQDERHLQEIANFFKDFISYLKNPYMIEGLDLGLLYSEITSKCSSCDCIAVKPRIDYAKFKNAVGTYASDTQYDEVIMQVDDTVFRSAKRGALVTKDFLVTKGMFESSSKYPLKNFENLTVSKTTVKNNNNQLIDFTVVPNDEVAIFTDCLKIIQKAFHTNVQNKSKGVNFIHAASATQADFNDLKNVLNAPSESVKETDENEDLKNLLTHIANSGNIFFDTISLLKSSLEDELKKVTGNRIVVPFLDNDINKFTNVISRLVCNTSENMPDLSFILQTYYFISISSYFQKILLPNTSLYFKAVKQSENVSLELLFFVLSVSLFKIINAALFPNKEISLIIVLLYFKILNSLFTVKITILERSNTMSQLSLLKKIKQINGLLENQEIYRTYMNIACYRGYEQFLKIDGNILDENKLFGSLLDAITMHIPKVMYQKKFTDIILDNPSLLVTQVLATYGLDLQFLDQVAENFRYSMQHSEEIKQNLTDFISLIDSTLEEYFGTIFLDGNIFLNYN